MHSVAIDSRNAVRRKSASFAERPGTAEIHRHLDQAHAVIREAPLERARERG